MDDEIFMNGWLLMLVIMASVVTGVMIGICL